MNTAFTEHCVFFATSPLIIINPVKKDKKKFKKNRLFLREIKNPNWLYVYYEKSISGVDEIRSILVRDSKNKIRGKTL